MKKISRYIGALAVLLSFGCAGTAQQLKLADIFSDNMVLQQEMPVPVWGWTSPGGSVTISIAGNRISGKADPAGKFMLRLPAMKAGGPFELRIESGDVIQLKNVLVGEVWFASGQSNMEFKLLRTNDAEKEIAEAQYPEIRLFNVPVVSSSTPAESMPGVSGWKECTPNAAKYFSAVAYHFAKNIHLSRKVPVGIINASLGSTRAEAWTSASTLLHLPDFRERIIALQKDTAAWNAATRKSIEAERQRPIIIKNAREGLNNNVHLPEYNDRDWKTATYPISMPQIGKNSYWGFVWFRSWVNVPQNQLASAWKLRLPITAEAAQVYLNGQELSKSVGTIYYEIPSGLLKGGRNLIAVRILSYRGTAVLGDSRNNVAATLEADGDKKIPIETSWRYHYAIEPAIAQRQDYPNTPSVLFNGMVAPVLPFAIRGVIWYQGEGNSNMPEQYRSLFPAMITDWRKKWGQGEFPFFFVQLAGRSYTMPVDIRWALLREAQAMALKLPNTGMAVAVDIGEKNDIHPQNKKDVGYRLALAARHVAYGEDIVYSGPVFQSLSVSGSVATIGFAHIGSGLEVRGKSELNGFFVAGTDRKFYPATAKIEGTTVQISSPNVKTPVAVRYAFSSWPEANLYNREGLPAVPFRTDQWPENENNQ